MGYPRVTICFNGQKIRTCGCDPANYYEREILNDFKVPRDKWRKSLTYYTSKIPEVDMKNFMARQIPYHLERNILNTLVFIFYMKHKRDRKSVTVKYIAEYIIGYDGTVFYKSLVHFKHHNIKHDELIHAYSSFANFRKFINTEIDYSMLMANLGHENN